MNIQQEDLVLREMYLTSPNSFKSSNGNELINIQLVGSKKMTVCPSLLYFGDMTLEQLKAIEGSKVNAVLQPGRQNFTIKYVEVVK